MSTSLTPKNQQLLDHAKEAFGEKSKLSEQIDTVNNALKIAILSCPDSPWEGVTSYSTIGLSDHPMLQDGSEFPVRLELAGACATEDKLFRNVMGAAAFSIMRTQAVYPPGSILEDHVKPYFPLTDLRHLYLTAPFLWDDALSTTLELDAKRVTWLLAFPISEKERKYCLKVGDEEFEEHLQEQEVDIFDLNRPSAV